MLGDDYAVMNVGRLGAETREQFQKTYDILDELRLDKVHLARYSPRPGTVSERRMPDDVDDAEKRRRYHRIEELQKEVSAEKIRPHLHTTVEVLVEGPSKKDPAFVTARTRGNKPIHLPAGDGQDVSQK